MERERDDQYQEMSTRTKTYLKNRIQPLALDRRIGQVSHRPEAILHQPLAGIVEVFGERLQSILLHHEDLVVRTHRQHLEHLRGGPQQLLVVPRVEYVDQLERALVAQKLKLRLRLVVAQQVDAIGDDGQQLVVVAIQQLHEIFERLGRLVDGRLRLVTVLRLQQQTVQRYDGVKHDRAHIRAEQFDYQRHRVHLDQQSPAVVAIVGQIVQHRGHAVVEAVVVRGEYVRSDQGANQFGLVDQLWPRHFAMRQVHHDGGRLAHHHRVVIVEQLGHLGYGALEVIQIVRVRAVQVDQLGQLGRGATAHAVGLLGGRRLQRSVGCEHTARLWPRRWSHHGVVVVHARVVHWLRVHRLLLLLLSVLVGGPEKIVLVSMAKFNYPQLNYQLVIGPPGVIWPAESWCAES